MAKTPLTLLAQEHPIAPGATGIDICITGHESIGPNRWAYRWKQVLLDKVNVFIDFPEDSASPALSSELEGYGLAYNSMESNNDAVGIEGSGDDLSQTGLNVDLTMLPLGVDAVIIGARLVEVGLGVDGATRRDVIFSAPNNTSGACSGQGPC